MTSFTKKKQFYILTSFCEYSGARFDNDLYTQYGKPGMSYDYGVWPLLRQDKGGPVISKGIAQGI